MCSYSHFNYTCALFFICSLLSLSHYHFNLPFHPPIFLSIILISFPPPKQETPLLPFNHPSNFLIPSLASFSSFPLEFFLPQLFLPSFVKLPTPYSIPPQHLPTLSLILSRTFDSPYFHNQSYTLP